MMMNSPTHTVGFGATYTTDDEAEKLLNIALSAGYRTINVCLAYHNLKGMGRALRNSGIPRSELTIIALDENERRSDINADHFDGYKASDAQIYDTLEQLGVEYVDCFAIHWPIPRYMENHWKKLNADSFRAMEAAANKGLVKSLGVSNFLPLHLEALLETAKLPIASNQLEIHPNFQQKATVDFCRTHNIAISAWSPLFKGKSVDLAPIVKLAQKYGKSPAQIILRWDIQNNITPIVASSNEKRIRENIDIFDFSISDEDISLIDSLENGEHIDNYSYARQLGSLKGGV